MDFQAQKVDDHITDRAAMSTSQETSRQNNVGGRQRWRNRETFERKPFKARSVNTS